MFSSLTLSAIAVLHGISVADEEKLRSLSSPETCMLLDSLTAGGIIRLTPGKPCDNLASYRLVRPLETISLLCLLDTLGESLDNVHCVDNDFYAKYGLAARKLGVINQVTRTYLSEINVTDIPTATTR